MVGETLGNTYRLARLLGEGGMGAVYEAEHTETGERAAVKVVHEELLGPDSTGASRFRREARAASAIDSEHIVRVLDTGVDEPTGALYIAMEYLEGEDLQRLLDRVGPLHPGLALRIAAQALLGLGEAHRAGIVHRDIKPANLFLARSGGGPVTVKILDFGIAKVTSDAALGHTTGLTSTGGMLGSPLYMSPEQVQNSKSVDHRTDLWSLGTTLYCALAGQAPHQHIATIHRLVVAICATPAPPLHERAPWIRPELSGVVHGALALRPEGRYPSADAMLEAIRAFVADGLEVREEMLVGIGAEEREALAALPAMTPTDIGLGPTLPALIRNR